MFFMKIYNYIRGFLTITVEGFFIERFINICTRKNIHLWDLVRLGDRKMRMNISIAGFKRIAVPAYRSRSKVKIMRKRGLPFLIAGYRGRLAFFVGLGLFIAVLYFLTLFVWDIDVSGNENVSRDEVMEALNSFGLRHGTLINAVDTDSLRHSLMNEIDEFVWVGLNIKGTIVKVDVRERVDLPPMVSDEVPSHIKARRAGIITDIIVTNGDKIAREGESVAQGQLLVSGLLDSVVLGQRYQDSRGIVMAQTLYQEEEEIPAYVDERVPTGRKKSRNQIEIFGHPINFFFKWDVPYTDYDFVQSGKPLRLGADNILPFAMKYNTFYEVEIVRRELTAEEGETILENALRERIEQQTMEAEVLLIEKEVIDNRVRLTYNCKEDIAEKVPIW